jgi:hypothetical protein
MWKKMQCCAQMSVMHLKYKGSIAEKTLKGRLVDRRCCGGRI